jgi:hypothetical protein
MKQLLYRWGEDKYQLEEAKYKAILKTVKKFTIF